MRVVMYTTYSQAFEIEPGSDLERALRETYSPGSEKLDPTLFTQNIESAQITPLSEPFIEDEETEVVSLEED